MRKALLPLALFLTLGARCDGITEPPALEHFYARPGMLVLENQAAEPLYTAVMDEHTAQLVDLNLCLESGCGLIAALSTKNLPIDSIPGAEPGDLIYVYSWRSGCCGPADGPVPYNLRLSKVRLSSGLLD